MPTKMDLDWQKNVEQDDPAQYQRAVLFNARFQKTEACKDFRKAWGIPAAGFEGFPEFRPWQIQLIERTNEYLKGDKYATLQRKIDEKRHAMARHEITDFDLLLFGMSVGHTVPMYKYDYDIDQITLRSGAPVYWRDFVEQCLLYGSLKKMYVLPIHKPLPEPKLKWDRESQYYDLVIENVFPDTNVREFTDRRFGKKLKELQKKLPGYQAKKIRLKKNLRMGLQVLEMDEVPTLTDSEKADALAGEIPGDILGSSFGRLERKRVARIKQLRHRTKKALK